MEFIAPEVHTGHSNLKSDVFSVGVLLCVLLTGYAPYVGVNESDTRREVVKGGLPFNYKDYENASPLAKDFMTRCLRTKPEERPSADELLQHRWITC